MLGSCLRDSISSIVSEYSQAAVSVSWTADGAPSHYCLQKGIYSKWPGFAHFMFHTFIAALNSLTLIFFSPQIPNLSQIYLIGFYEEREFALYVSSISNELKVPVRLVSTQLCIVLSTLYVLAKIEAAFILSKCDYIAAIIM